MSIQPAASFPKNVRLLLAARVCRSLGQGVLVVSFALYLHALGYSGGTIGTVLMAGLMFGAALTAIVGPLSDRRGRRNLLIGYECVALLAALAALLTYNHVVLIAAAVIAGFGRGANGAAGPFAPVEQAWLAREVSGLARRRVLALNATLGFLGMAAGAALVALPALSGRGYADIGSYRILFVIPLAGSVIAITLLLNAREKALVAEPVARGDNRSEHEITREENRQLRRLALANAANGLGIGIVGPLIAYWFTRRFGQSPVMIGPAIAGSFVLGAIGSTAGSWLSVRFGAVRTVLWMRSVGLILLLATPFAGTFGLAAAFYASRAAFNQGTTGARQSIAADLTRAERRGLGASVQNLSLQIPRSIGPVIGGWLIHTGAFVAPFLLATALQSLYLGLYWWYFAHLDRDASGS